MLTTTMETVTMTRFIFVSVLLTARQIIARGPQVVMGYLDSPDATAETFGSGSKRFLRTGDIGFIDTDGFVHIKDRIKELIKVRPLPCSQCLRFPHKRLTCGALSFQVQGVGVAPAELEAILMTHGAVADAAVCGIHDELRGQVPKAYVVLRAGITPDSAMAISIQGFVRERASRAKWLRGGVAFLERIPKSASGKILRRKLASAHPLLELAWNGMHGRL
jgi:acyl-coenzyme A synthetase/AMP-(fatty) acid ligase